MNKELLSYERNRNHTYIIYTTDIREQDFGIQMLIHNKIKGLLPCHVKKVDGRVRMYYEITSKQSLTSFFQIKKMDNPMLMELFKQIRNVMAEMESFLLSSDDLVLDADLIYMDPENYHFYFFVFPGIEQPDKSIHIFLEYILNCVDYMDKKAVSTVYECYNKSGKENFSLSRILEEIFSKKKGEVDALEKPEESQLYIPEEKEEFQRTPPQEPLLDRVLTEQELWELEQGGENKKCKEDKKKLHRKEERQASESKTGYAVSEAKAAAVSGTVTLFLLTAFLGSGNILLNVVIATLLGLGIGAGLRYYKNREREGDEEETDFWLGSEEELQTNKEENRDIIDEDGVYRINNQTAQWDEIQESLERMEQNNENTGYGETVFFQNRQLGSGRRLEPVKKEFPEFPIQLFPFIIGKLSEAVDGVIDQETVSRIHCKLEMEDGQYYITDLNSTNGTIVNEHLLKTNERVQVQVGDEICIGQVQYHLR